MTDKTNGLEQRGVEGGMRGPLGDESHETGAPSVLRASPEAPGRGGEEPAAGGRESTLEERVRCGQAVKVLILGEPASKANSRQIVTIRGRPAVIKSAKARSYERSAGLQVGTLRPLLTGPLRATIRIWYASERPDLDESVVLDVLQGRIYANDRQVRERHTYHGIDRANPRAEVVIEPMAAHSGT